MYLYLKLTICRKCVKLYSFLLSIFFANLAMHNEKECVFIWWLVFFIVLYYCMVYEWRMEVKLSALLGNHDKHINRQTIRTSDQTKDGQTGWKGSFTSIIDYIKCLFEVAVEPALPKFYTDIDNVDIRYFACVCLQI